MPQRALQGEHINTTAHSVCRVTVAQSVRVQLKVSELAPLPRRNWDYAAPPTQTQPPKNPMRRWGGEGLRRSRERESGWRNGLEVMN